MYVNRALSIGLYRPWRTELRFMICYSIWMCIKQYSLGSSTDNDRFALQWSPLITGSQQSLSVTMPMRLITISISDSVVALKTTATTIFLFFFPTFRYKSSTELTARFTERQSKIGPSNMVVTCTTFLPFFDVVVAFCHETSTDVWLNH